MKKAKTIFWITTIIIFLFEGVIPALTSHSVMAVEGIVHLGYPYYFITLLTLFKVFGALALIIPKVPARVKEWAYAGFGIDFICAVFSIVAVDGFVGTTMAPVIAMVILVLSYVNYHKINENK
jgi:DoxX-like family